MPTEDCLRMRRECPVGIFRFQDAARGEEMSRFDRMSKGAMGSCFEGKDNGGLQSKYSSNIETHRFPQAGAGNCQEIYRSAQADIV